MEGLSFLTILSFAMLLGSYSSGYLPMMVTMTEARMRRVSLFGAGLLIGTALSVIIPEGVEALYNAQKDSAPHSHEFHGVQNNAEAQRILEEANKGQELPPRIIPKDAVLNEGLARQKRDTESESFWNNVYNKAVPARFRRNTEDAVFSDKHEHEHEHEHSDVHQRIGYSLVLGFIFMLIVDQISNATVSRNDRSGRSRMGLSATIGLVVHAAADGIALGSASVINKSDVQLIVFVAIMLHKAPASFGLVSFLLMEKIDERTVRKYLLVFACAAPVAAVITFIVLSNMGTDSIATGESSTGVLMLFSAGTFLYVSTVHVLPELANHKGNDYALVDMQTPSTAGHSHNGGTNFSFGETLLVMGGAIVPAFLSSGHSH